MNETATKWSPLHCGKDALVDSYGRLVQLALACVAFACLALKRACEPRAARRSWRVWFYDASKQGAGALLVHALNVWLASRPFAGADPCTWYIVNFLLDSTLGLLVVWACIRLAHRAAEQSRKRCAHVNFGEYGSPPSAAAWGCQCVLYMLIMLLMKAVVVVAVWFLDRIGATHFILSPISDPRVELAIIMLIIPFFVNILLFWVTDNFLMHRPHPDNSKIKSKVRYRSINRNKPGSDSDELSADERLLGANA